METNRNSARYTLAPAPKFAGMMEWDCGFCSFETLKRPVFLTSGAGTVAAGSRCAAIALGLVEPSAKPAAASRALKAHQDELHAAEQAAWQAQRDAEHIAWKAFLAGAAGPGDTVEQIARLGGFAAARAAFKSAVAA